MVGKTAAITSADRQRFDTIKVYCGCLPCLLMGYLDVPTTIEHVTDRGRRLKNQHFATIGLCTWHHFGWTKTRSSRAKLTKERGPSLALGRLPFEAHFGDEIEVLLPVQNALLSEFERAPWPEYAVPRRVVRRIRRQWMKLSGTTTT